MSETEKNWDSILKSASRKILLCADKWDRDDWMNSLKRALDRDSTYEYQDRKGHFELLVSDRVLNVNFLVNTINVNQWSWSMKARG